MADNTVELHFASDLGQQLPGIVASLRSLVNEFQNAASETDSISLLGNIGGEVDEALGMIRGELPRALQQLRAQFEQGIVPKNVGAEVSGTVRTLIDSFAQLKSASGGVLDDAQFGRGLLTMLAEAQRMLTAIKVEAKEAGASTGQLSSLSRSSNQLSAARTDIAGQFGLDPVTFESLRGEARQLTVAYGAERSATDAVTRAKKAEAAAIEAETRRRAAAASSLGSPPFSAPPQQDAARPVQGPVPSAGFVQEPSTGPTGKVGATTSPFGAPQPPDPITADMANVGPDRGLSPQTRFQDVDQGLERVAQAAERQARAEQELAAAQEEAAAQTKRKTRKAAATPADSDKLEPNYTLYRGEGIAGQSGGFYTAFGARASAFSNIADPLGGMRVLRLSPEDYEKAAASPANQANVAGNKAYQPGDLLLSKELQARSSFITQLPPAQQLEELRRLQTNLAADTGLTGALVGQPGGGKMADLVRDQISQLEAATAAPPPATPTRSKTRAPQPLPDGATPEGASEVEKLLEQLKVRPQPTAQPGPSTEAVLTPAQIRAQEKELDRLRQLDEMHESLKSSGDLLPMGMAEAVKRVTDPKDTAFRTRGASDYGGGVFGFPDNANPGESPFFQHIPAGEENPEAFGRITGPARVQSLADLVSFEEGGRYDGDTNPLEFARSAHLQGRHAGNMSDLDFNGQSSAYGAFRYDLLGQSDRVSAEEQLRRQEDYSRQRNLDPALNDLEKRKPGNRDLNATYTQVGEVLQRQTQFGLRDLEGQTELFEARKALARALEQEANAARRAAGGGGRGGFGGGRGGGAGDADEPPRGFFAGVLGGAFGHGFNSNAQFDPKQAIGNLGGTLGVVARYSSEYAAYAAITQGLKGVYEQAQLVNEQMVLYRSTLEATGASQVDLNRAFDAGATYGLNQADSLALGTAGLKAYQDEIHAGASASDVFANSVKQAGIAAQLTGQQAAQAQAQLIAATNVFNIGSSGQGRVNDAVLSASQNFAVKPADILKGLGTAGDLANVGGFTPELLANTLGAVQQTTGQEQSAQVTRDLAQGGSTRFRTALSNLGVTYDSGDVAGTLEKAGAAYAKLSDAKKNDFAISLGGARSASTLIALLKDQNDIVNATSKSYENGGKAAQEAANYNKTFGGTIKQIGAVAKDLAADLGKSGLLDFFGLLLASIKPVLTGVDDLVKGLDALKVGGVGPGDLLGGALLFRGVAAVGGGKGLLGGSPDELGRGPGQNFGRGFRRLTGRGDGAGAAEDTEQQTHTKSVVSDTAATTEHTAVTREQIAQAELQLEAAKAQVSQQTAEAEAEAVQVEQTNATTASLQGLMVAAREATAAFEAETAASEEKTLTDEVAPVGRGGVGPGAIITGVIADAMIGYESYKKTNEIIDKRNAAENAAQSNGVSGNTDQLRAGASAANSAAQDAAISSGGLFGSLENYFSGGNSQQIADARSTAKRDAGLADRLDKISANNAEKGAYGQLDLSSPETLDSSFQAAQKSGASLADQMRLLDNALNSVQASAAGATRILSTADQQKAGAVGGAYGGEFLRQAITDAAAGAEWGTPGYKDAGALFKSLKGVDSDKLQATAEISIDDFLKANPSYDPKKKNAKGQTGERQLVDSLTSSLQSVPGFSKLPKHEQQVLVNMLGANVDQTLGPVAGVDASPATIIEGFNLKDTNAQAQSAAISTRLGAGDFSGDPKAKGSSDETAVIAARDYLTKLTKARDEAVGSKKLTPDQIKDLNTKVDAAKSAYNATLIQQYADQSTIADSNLALSDKLGRDDDQIATDEKTLAATLDAGAKKLAAAKLKTDKMQRAVDEADTQASAISAGALQFTPSAGVDSAGKVSVTGTPGGAYDPTNVSQNAAKKLQGDQVKFQQIADAEKGVKEHSETYWRLWMTLFDDQQNNVQIVADIASSAAAAAADPESQIDQAQAQTVAAFNALVVAGNDTAKQNAAIQQGKAAMIARLNAYAEDAKNIATLGGDSTDPVYAAWVNAATAIKQLQDAQARGATPDVIRAKQIAATAAEHTAQKSAEDQWLSDNQTNYDLHRQSFTQYLSNLEARDALLKRERSALKAGSDGYRQFTDEINDVEKQILDATNQLQGQFNLGDIKVPTVYEVRRQVATGNANTGFSDNRVTSITINGIGSTQEVVQIVKAQLGTSATVTRAPATTRKA